MFVHHEFDTVASSFPERIALQEGNTTLRYRELRARSAAMAAGLRRHGVGTGDVVGVFMDRSIDYIVTVLAVLKAGAAYLPMTPDQPIARTSKIFGDVGVGLVVAAAAHADGFAGGPVKVVVPADLEDPGAETAGFERAAMGSAVDALAYVMHTSGSTGSPKAVAVTHENVTQLVRGQRFVRFDPDQVFLQLSTCTFDASTFEIWGALLSGARLVLAPTAHDALDELPGLLELHRISVLFLTTPLFHELASTRPEALDAVRQLLVGGEIMSVELARTVAARPARREPGAVFANVYGPTETTTFASWFDLRDLPADAATVPIGRPLEHSTLHVLGAGLEPVAVGEVGEIYIGGRGVARGYLNDPELTRKRFVADPFTGDGAGRMYRSGDLGRRLADNTVDFVGRFDDQVKIRGFRVEPGEVAQHLLDHPSVRDAAVVAIPQASRSHRLAAFLVLSDPTAAGRDDFPSPFVAYLAERLPHYMVPQSFTVLDHLPLNATGKLDRAVLKRLESDYGTAASASQTGAVRSLPAGGAEQLLAGIWCDTLKLAEVGIDDDFFALGGDSILVLRLVAAAEEAGLAISIRDVFQTPTIRGLCAGIADARSSSASDAGERAAHAHAHALPGVDDVYPTTQMQLGLIYEAAASEDGSLYHDGISVIVEAPLDADALRRSFETVARRHEILRTRFDISGFDEPMQVVETEPRIPVSISDLSRLVPEDRERAVQGVFDDLMRPFDIESAPLIRVHAASLGPGSFQLLFAFHHAIMDGWSESLLLSEFALCYDAYTAGRTPSLPRLGNSRYRDLTTLERRALESPQCREFWESRCGGMSPVLIGGPRSAHSSQRTKARLNLPTSLLRSLETTSRAVPVPLKSLLLAGHLAVLADVAAVGDPVSGLVVNSRPESVGGDSIIGLFLNLLPVTATVGDCSWADLARRMLQAEQEFLPYRRYPYPALQNLAGGRLFDVAFNYTRFHVYTELESKTELRISGHQIRDKASIPMMVDLLHEADGSALSIEISGDAARWTETTLQALCTAYAETYERIVDQPSAIAGRDGASAAVREAC